MNFNNNDLKKLVQHLLIQKNNLDQASNIYKNFKKNPNNFDANFNLGTILAKNNLNEFRIS